MTKGASESADVLQEVQIANAARVKITPIVVRGAQPSDDLAYHIGVRHQVAWSGAEAAANAVAGVRPGSSPPPAPPSSPGPALARRPRVTAGVGLAAGRFRLGWRLWRC